MKQYPKGNELIRTLVVISDFLIINAVLSLYIVCLPDWVPEYFHSATKTTFIVAAFALMISQYFYSTVIHVRKISYELILKQTAKLSLTQAVLMFVFLRILSEAGEFFHFIFIYWASIFGLLILSRILERTILKYYRSKGRNTRSVIFVGSDPANLAVYNSIVDDPSTGYKVLGYYGDAAIEGAPAEFKRLGTREDLKKMIAENSEFDPSMATKECGTVVDKQLNAFKTDELFCCLSHTNSDEIKSIMRFCDRNVIRFYYVPRAFANMQLNLEGENFMGTTLFTNHHEPLSEPWNKLIKRLFDIAFSATVLLCMLPFFPIIALIIKIQSPGPIFFRQDRTGMNGITFKCMKFRSMHISNDADTKQATKDDPRKFPFGNLMRKLNIDELPQFINVLTGDMSIVGPRPHMLLHTEMYSKEISKYMVRHFAKPGITGLAQVTGYRGETKYLWQMKERVKRDIYYIENWSPWLDIKIILLTAKSMIIPDKNAY